MAKAKTKKEANGRAKRAVWKPQADAAAFFADVFPTLINATGNANAVELGPAHRSETSHVRAQLRSPLRSPVLRDPRWRRRVRVLVTALALVACKHTATTTHEQFGNAITVSAELPGSTAEQTANELTAPLEHAFGRLEKLAAMESRTTAGRTEILLGFAADKPIDQAEQNVQTAINAASKLLPPLMPAPPVYAKAGPSGAVMRVILAATAPNDVVQNLAHELEMVAGVGRVETCGDVHPRIVVLVDPLRLAASGKSIEDVISAANDPADQLEQNPLLRETSTVSHVGQPSTCLAFDALGRRAIALTIKAQPGQDPVAVRERLEAALKHAAPPIAIEVLPRTRPVTYRLRWSSDVPNEKRTLDLADVIGEIHAQHILAELGEFDRDIAELHVVGEVADIDRIAAAHDVALLAPSDHVIGLAGPDLNVLENEASAIRRTLKVSAVIGANREPQVEIKLDRDRMTELGIRQSGEAARLLAAAMGEGTHAAVSFSQMARTEIVVKIDGKLPELLDLLRVHTATGVQLPLSQIATVTQTSQPSEIIHHGALPWLGVRVTNTVDEIADALASIPVPAGTTREVVDPHPQLP